MLMAFCTGVHPSKKFRDSICRYWVQMASCLDFDALAVFYLRCTPDFDLLESNLMLHGQSESDSLPLVKQKPCYEPFSFISTHLFLISESFHPFPPKSNHTLASSA